MMTAIANTKLRPLLQEFRQGLEDLYGDRLMHIVLFGSYARQQATPSSDIDIAVVLKSFVSPGDEIFRMSTLKTQLNLDYSELISVLPISEADYKHGQTPLLEAIREEGICV